MTYTPKTFNLPALEGISDEQIKVHLGLYEGYVKHVNLVMEKIKEMKEDVEKNAYAIAEVRRRFAFEFDGMRMHEYYFEQLEGGAQAQDPESKLAKAATDKYGSYENLVAHVKEVAGSRGIGWVVVYVDPKVGSLHTTFVNDHELGQLAGLPIVLALDLWEHAFMVDYRPATKGDYVSAFFNNLNWSVVEERVVKSIAASDT